MSCIELQNDLYCIHQGNEAEITLDTEDNMRYLMIDTTAKKSNPSFGFANTKIAIAFETKKLRDDYLADREFYDLSAKKITRAQALKMLVKAPWSQDKGLPLNQADFTIDFVVMRESAF